MRICGRSAVLGVLCAGIITLSAAQDPSRPANYDRNSPPATLSNENAGDARVTDASTAPHRSKHSKNTSLKRGHKSEKVLSSDDRLAVIASALDSKTPRFSERDCSHLVHAIYQRAGFPYSYVDSDQLYDGVEGFERVSRPDTGDLVVWQGHVGIVIRPSKHVFFSFLHAGPGIEDYENRYWRGRGRPRFYRYIKNDRCAGCVLARGRAE
jgi:cell wall-associated NlpC family hydrolase